jgi:hypothetical protein
MAAFTPGKPPPMPDPKDFQKVRDQEAFEKVKAEDDVSFERFLTFMEGIGSTLSHMNRTLGHLLDLQHKMHNEAIITQRHIKALLEAWQKPTPKNETNSNGTH